MTTNQSEKIEFVGFEVASDFLEVFDHLAMIIGCNRPELMVHTLKSFTRLHLNNSENKRIVRENIGIQQ